MAKKVKKTAKKTTSSKTVIKKTAKKTVKKASPKTSANKTAKKATRKTTPKTSKKKTAKAVSPKPSASASPKRKTRKRPKSILSKAELQHFRDLLIVKLKEIIGDVDHFEAESLKKSRLDASGDLSSMPIHMADIGSDNYEQEFALGLMDSERKLVHEIYAALKRIDDGSYGICEGTGEPIPKPRLEGIPWTRYCVEYAEKIEKGLISDEDRWYDSDYEDDDQLDTEEDEDADTDEIFDDDDDDEDDIIFYGYHDDDDEDEDLD